MRRIGNSRGEMAVATIITVIVVFVLGGLGAVFEMFSGSAAPTPGMEDAVHTGVIASVNHEIAGGMDVTVVGFKEGVSYTISGYHNVSPGEMCRIVRTAAGYDLQLM